MDQAKLFLSSFGGKANPSDPGDPIGQSLRFRGGQTLTNTDIQTTGTDNLWTLSLWVKYTHPEQNGTHIFLGNQGGSAVGFISILSSGSVENGAITVNCGTGGGGFSPTKRFRDPSAWYHMVLAYNGADQEIDFTINGERVTTGTGPLTSTGTRIDDIIFGHNNFDGYLANVYFIDGEALDPTTFGRYNNNDVWVPVEPSGLTFGDNGFHLDFADRSFIGKDVSGNGNNFTNQGFNFDPIGVYTPFLTSSGAFSSSFPASNCFTAGQPEPYCSDTGTGTFTFAPATPLEITDKLEVYNWAGRLVYSFDSVSDREINSQGTWNEVYVVGADGGATTLSADNPLTIAMGSPATGNTAISGIRVDGVILIDNPGGDYDLMQDSPTQNYSTYNPLGFNNGALSSVVNLSNANLDFTLSSDPDIGFTIFTIPSSGKYYFELTPPDTECVFRLYSPKEDNQSANLVGNSAQIYSQASRWIATSSGSLAPNGNADKNVGGSVKMQVAIDADNQRIYLGDGETNNWLRNAGPGTYSVGTFDANQPSIDYSTLDEYGRNNAQIGITGVSGVRANFGQTSFVMPIPEGWNTEENHLQTQNLPEASILNARDHFQAITGPGTGANATVVPGQRGGDFSKDVYGDNTSTYDPTNTNKIFLDESLNFGPDNMFNGVLNNDDWPNTCKSGTGSAQTWIYWRPDPAITGVTSLSINCSNTQTVRINGGAPTGQTNSSISNIDIASPPSTITEIAIQGNTISSATIGGIVINGEVLVENSILTQARATFPNGLYWIKDRVNNNNWQLACSEYDVAPTDNVLIPNGNNYTPYVAPTGDSVAYCWDLSDPAQTGVEFISDTGTGVQRTVSHNLGRVPGMIWAHNMVAPASNNLWCYHRGVGAGGSLNFSGADGPDNRDIFWGGVEPTETEFTVGVGGSTNPVGDVYYFVFADVPGFSAFGSYTGNGDSNDGPFIHTGFSVGFVMVKSITATGSWMIYDSTRDPNNPVNHYLYANQTDPEAPNLNVDFLSNGFKMRNVTTSTNTTGVDYVYAAFALNPFQSPVTAR